MSDKPKTAKAVAVPTERPYGLIPNPELAEERERFERELADRASKRPEAKRPAAKAIPQESITVADNPLPPDMPTVEVPAELAEQARKAAEEAIEKNTLATLGHTRDPQWREAWGILEEALHGVERSESASHAGSAKRKKKAMTLAVCKLKAPSFPDLLRMLADEKLFLDGDINVLAIGHDEETARLEYVVRGELESTWIAIKTLENTFYEVRNINKL